MLITKSKHYNLGKIGGKVLARTIRACLVKICHFYFCDNFGKCRPILNNYFTATFSDKLRK